MLGVRTCLPAAIDSDTVRRPRGPGKPEGTAGRVWPAGSRIGSSACLGARHNAPAERLPLECDVAALYLPHYRPLPGDLMRRLALVILVTGCAAGPPAFDVVIRGGTVYDGSGSAPLRADIAIAGDSIVQIGDLAAAQAPFVIDATGLAVAPGFINMLSWANESLIQDGRSQSDIRQGVTLELFGEGSSMGPLNEQMKQQMKAQQGDIKFDITWTTLGEYLSFLEQKGVSTNVASLIGATTVRVHELGYEDREPTPAELERMRALVRQAMEEGAFGIGSSLIYAPAFY